MLEMLSIWMNKAEYEKKGENQAKRRFNEKMLKVKAKRVLKEKEIPKEMKG